jgi:hypothetical protein
VNNGTSNYTVYQNATTNSQVLVKSGVVVTNNDPEPFVAGDVTVNGVTMSLDYQWVQNGKTYFAVKNFSGTGDSNNNTMYTTHTLLDTLFNGGADTVDTTVTAGVDDARTFLSGGYTFVLPTQAELVALSNTIPTTGWYNNRYWSSSLVSANTHVAVGIAGDWIYNAADSSPEMLVLQVLPVVLDLNRDGILSYGQVTMDVNGDGHLDITKWAGAQDGVLIWDKYMDGLVHDNSQYAFAQYATTYANGLDAQGKAPTDLSGLAEAFDSNHDGMFNAQDVKFAEFKVWQDANQNGISDAGEVLSLADWGITSINLVSDGVVRSPVAGVTEAGRTIATTTDGQSMLVADAAFAFRDATADEVLMNMFSLKSGMQLDLTAVLKDSASKSIAAGLTHIDMSADTESNLVTLTMADVLSLPATNGVHQLVLTGAANDKLMLAEGEWTDSGEVVAQEGRSYAVYTGSTDASAQLLIDQHIMTLQASS